MLVSLKNIKEYHNLPEISIEKQKIIESFIDEFSKFSTVDLFFIIRNQKPWILTYNPNHIKKINKELMADSSFH